MSAFEDFSLLPDNRSALERGLELAFTRQLYAISNPYPGLLNPAVSPAAVLPHLAHDRGVTEWDAAAPETEKRSTVASIWPLRRQAGMKAAIRHAVESLGMTVEIIPWFDTGAAPYFLELWVWADEQQLTSELNSRLDLRLAEAVAERDEFSVNLARGSTSRPRFGVAMEAGITLESLPFVPTGTESASVERFALAMHSREIVTSEPAIQ